MKEDSSQGANSTNYYASAILADKIEILTILAFKVKKITLDKHYTHNELDHFMIRIIPFLSFVLFYGSIQSLFSQEIGEDTSPFPMVKVDHSGTTWYIEMIA